MTDLQGRLVRLRHLLHQPGTPETWQSLLAVFRTWPSTSSQEIQVGLDYALGLLDQWPDDIRQPEPEWLHALLFGRPPPQTWLLVRTVRFEQFTVLHFHQLIHDRALVGHLRHLNVSSCWMDDRAIESLITTAHLDQLRTLDMTYNHITSRGLSKLLRAVNLPDSLVVDLRHNHTSMVDVLDHDPPAFGVRFDSGLTLRRITPARLRAICTAPLFACAEAFSLPEGNDMGPVLLDALLSAPDLSRMVEVRLPQARLGGDPQVGAQLRALTERCALTTLNLRHNRLTPNAFRPLSSNPTAFAELTHLDLGHNPTLGDGGLALLLRPLAAHNNLTALNLEHCNLSSHGIIDLAHTAQLAQLTQLELGGNPLGDTGLQALLDAPFAPNLTSLGLAQTGITDIGLEALLASPQVAQLQHVHIGTSSGFSQWITAEFNRRFINSSIFPHHIDDDDIPF